MQVQAFRLIAALGAFVAALALDLRIGTPSNGDDDGSWIAALVGAAALADDDDDDDDDDDGRRRRPRPRASPEFVVSAPAPTDIDRIAALGYTIVARRSVAATNAEIARVRPPAGMTLARARAQVTTQVPGAIIDLNHVYRPDAVACGARGCRAFEMVGWPTRPDCRLVPTIGMVDTGVNVRHPALRGSSIEILRSTSPGRTPSARVHGTAIAALLVGRPDSAAPGLLPDARLIAAEAFHRDARGSDAADAFDLALAVDDLAARNVSVINMSFSGPANAVFQQVIAAVARRGIGLVAAAGNAGARARPLYSGAYADVIAVTAVDHNGRLYRHASTGEHVDFAAPGVRLQTAAASGGSRLRSGTSYAAPFVTAAIAVKRLRSPQSPLEESVAHLAKHAVDLGSPGRDHTFGWGLLQMPDACSARPAG